MEGRDAVWPRLIASGPHVGSGSYWPLHSTDCIPPDCQSAGRRPLLRRSEGFRSNPHVGRSAFLLPKKDIIAVLPDTRSSMGCVYEVN